MFDLDKYYPNMKEQVIKSRPTSSSSSFMYISPLVGLNKYNQHLRFQPLDEDIPEENENGKLKRTSKAQKKKVKKKKKKVIKCKQYLITTIIRK